MLSTELRSPLSVQVLRGHGKSRSLTCVCPGRELQCGAPQSLEEICTTRGVSFFVFCVYVCTATHGTRRGGWSVRLGVTKCGGKLLLAILSLGSSPGG